MRSIETEGAQVALADQAFGAEMREALAVLEACDEAAEAAPAGLGRVAAGVGEVWLEAAASGLDAGDLAGAQIDHQVKLGVGVGQAAAMMAQ